LNKNSTLSANRLSDSNHRIRESFVSFRDLIPDPPLPSALPLPMTGAISSFGTYKETEVHIDAAVRSTGLQDSSGRNTIHVKGQERRKNSRNHPIYLQRTPAHDIIETTAHPSFYHKLKKTHS
jgi:hypothetical protein